MNDFSEVEAELKGLRPAPVSPELWARIERGFALRDVATAGLLSPRRRRIAAWWTLGLSLAAACVAIMAGLAFFSPSPDSATSVAQNKATSSGATSGRGLQPSALTRVVYRRRDEGLVFSPNQSEQLLRRVRYETRETMQWRNPQTGASLRVSYPAEQVVLTPVSFQ
ncbi:MAG TPA: hypothetical protein VGF73_02195 [Chthoniobacterales bacterium]|jgi:hypothetical protein